MLPLVACRPWVALDSFRTVSRNHQGATGAAKELFSTLRPSSPCLSIEWQKPSIPTWRPCRERSRLLDLHGRVLANRTAFWAAAPFHKVAKLIGQRQLDAKIDSQRTACSEGGRYKSQCPFKHCGVEEGLLENRHPKPS